jgi:hypothetical protein
MHTFLKFWLVFGAAIGISNAAYATQCTQDDLTRIVTIVYSEPGQPTPCEVLYEKSSEGDSMTLWRAQNQPGYCEERASEFVEKLSQLGWSCTEQATQPDAAEAPESEG